MFLIWIGIFGIALAVLLKGADLMLESSERIGLALGLSSFIIGVLIVGLGTSFPELVSSFIAVFQGHAEIVAANAIGSNVANILLVVGISAVLGRKLIISKNLIDLDLPLLSASTFIFLAAAYDGVILRVESLLLLTTFAFYFLYTLDTSEEKGGRDIPELDILDDHDVTSIDRDKDGLISKKEGELHLLSLKDIALFFVGAIMLFVGAKFLIDSVIHISSLVGITTGVIALVAVAIGTSLPELLVSIKAAKGGNSDIALGNIFGSNAFNLLVVVGLPGLFSNLALDGPTLAIGLPALVVTTFLFVISGISRRIHLWEGFMFVMLYIFFVLKLFGVV